MDNDPTTFSHTLKAADLDLLPGTAVLINLAVGGATQRGVFIGMEPEKYVILRVPAVSGGGQQFKAGDDIQVKFMHHAGVVGGFRTTVTASIQQPVPLVFVEVPHNAEILTRRAHERIQTCLPATAVYEDLAMEGCMLNLSSGGCLFSVCCEEGTTCSERYADIKIGRDIVCIFRTRSSEEEKLVVGEVRSVNRREEVLDIGVYFASLSGEHAESVREYLRQIEFFVK